MEEKASWTGRGKHVLALNILKWFDRNAWLMHELEVAKHQVDDLEVQLEERKAKVQRLKNAAKVRAPTIKVVVGGAREVLWNPTQSPEGPSEEEEAAYLAYLATYPERAASIPERRAAYLSYKDSLAARDKKPSI